MGKPSLRSDGVAAPRQHHQSLRAQQQAQHICYQRHEPHQMPTSPEHRGSPVQETRVLPRQPRPQRQTGLLSGPLSPLTAATTQSLFGIPNRLPDNQPEGALGSLPWSQPPTPIEGGSRHRRLNWEKARAFQALATGRELGQWMDWLGGKGTYRGRQECRPPGPKEQGKVLDLEENRSQQAFPGPSLHPQASLLSAPYTHKEHQWQAWNTNVQGQREKWGPCTLSETL